MKALKIFALAALSFWTVACSQVNFSAVKDDGSPAVSPPELGQTCNVETIYRKTKILFLVDTSGSNATSTYNIINGQTVLTPATDANKNFRGGAINQFFTNYQHKTNFNWGFTTFSSGHAYAYINNGSYQSPLFTSNTSLMSAAIAQFYNQIDEGDTPYRSAISLAATAVGTDPDLNSADKPNYFVILLSDGFPTDYTDAYGNFLSAQMKSDVAALLAKAPGRVTLSTIFYGTMNIPQAISDLQQIATAGGGQFASVNVSNTSFKIEDVISSTSTTCTP